MKCPKGEWFATLYLEIANLATKSMTEMESFNKG